MPWSQKISVSPGRGKAEVSAQTEILQVISPLVVKLPKTR